MFGLELRLALKTRDQTQRGLCAGTSISRSRLANWVTGTSLPSVETAEHLADLLMWPRLAVLCRKARTRACDSCGRTFAVESPSPQRYCSLECRRFHAKVVDAGGRDYTRAVLERRTRRYRDAVAAMCAGCEPSGICRTPSCPLQVGGVSPFAIAKDAVA